MTEKRFGITPELPKGWTDIIDTDDDRTLCNIRIEYANNMIKLLNELYEENMKLKSENEYLRCTIKDYKSSEECNKEFINNLHDYNQKLKKENEQLKIQLQNTSDQRDEFGRGARENANRVGKLEKENKQLKKGMIEIVDRYIKNVECNPPSSARIYGKIKGALINIREDLRNLIEDLE